jgi:hypothetical protein
MSAQPNQLVRLWHFNPIKAQAPGLFVAQELTTIARSGTAAQAQRNYHFPQNETKNHD